MLKLLKYEFLSKKTILLFFTLIIIGGYLTLLFKPYNGNSSKEGIFSICFLIFFVSLLVTFNNNIVFQQINDFNYLGFSLPIDPRNFFYKRLIVLFLEMIYFSMINILFLTIVMSRFDSNFGSIFFSYLFVRKGIVSIFLFIIYFLLLFIFAYTYSIVPFLPSELNFLKGTLLLLTSLLLIFSNRIDRFIQKIPFYTLRFHFSFPQFNLESIYNISNSSTSSTVIKAEFTPTSEFSILSLIFGFILILVYFLVNSYLTKEKIEIKR